MADGIPLRRIAGIRVLASWTLLIVVALLVLGLAGGVFPREYPGLTAGWYLAAAAVGAALFLVSLLAHELAHALVARRAGVAVESRTAARAGRVLGGILVGVRVRDAMTPSPVAVPASATVAQVLGDITNRLRFTSLPVLDDRGAVAGLVTLRRLREVPQERRALVLDGGHLVGIVSPADIMRALAADGRRGRRAGAGRY